jgi:hypothetical protein
VGERRGPILFEGTPGKGRGANETRVTSVPRFGTHRQRRRCRRESGFGNSEQCSEATFVANRNREEVTHRGGGLPGSEECWFLPARDRTDPRPEEAGSSSLDPAENAPRARIEQAVRMDDRSSGHAPRSGSRCPGDLKSRSHLDSSTARSVEVLLRPAAAASDGWSAGRTSLLRW